MVTGGRSCSLTASPRRRGSEHKRKIREFELKQKTLEMEGLRLRNITYQRDLMAEGPGVQVKKGRTAGLEHLSEILGTPVEELMALQDDALQTDAGKAGRKLTDSLYGVFEGVIGTITPNKYETTTGNPINIPGNTPHPSAQVQGLFHALKTDVNFRRYYHQSEAQLLDKVGGTSRTMLLGMSR
jgi:hypothetical protein